jgi:hypothetical protein
MPLTRLKLYGVPVSDLSPLKGMPLTDLQFDWTPVRDLSALKGMPLTALSCRYTPVSDLSPLKGMPLTSLNCGATRVSDLGPLEGMKLEQFTFTPKAVTRGIEIVRGMKSIKQISFEGGKLMSPEEFWKKYDAGEFK